MADGWRQCVELSGMFARAHGKSVQYCMQALRVVSQLQALVDDVNQPVTNVCSA